MNEEKVLSQQENLPNKTMSQNQMLSQNMLESFWLRSNIFHLNFLCLAFSKKTCCMPLHAVERVAHSIWFKNVNVNNGIHQTYHRNV